MADDNSNQGSIFNIGDLAKPVEILIQRTFDFVGAALAPYQLIRMAKANVKVVRIERLGNVETDISERALQRLLAKEIRNQENIENIVRLALPEIKEDAKPEEISDDWFSLFFDKCKQFSDDEMQILWAKILAGEANKSGTFSKRTVELVSILEKSEAELFTTLCGFNWHILKTPIEEIIPLIYIDLSQNLPPIYYKNKLTVENLIYLDSIGLIKFDSNGFVASPIRETLIASYFENQFKIRLRFFAKKELEIGQVRLTSSGRQLANICSSEKIDGFLEHTVSVWKGLGYRISPFVEKKQK